MTTNSSVNYDTIVPVHQEGTFTFPDLNQQHYRQGSVMNLTWESNLTNVDLAVTQHTKKTPFYFEYIGRECIFVSLTLSCSLAHGQGLVKEASLFRLDNKPLTKKFL